ncbi:helix-turn-helix domain-containing protein [Arthrobacter sp. NPDC058130]|uniref:helix-turn-helix domain-containing protein n=1 Tax=Arthrobacter sp. NPDC058130 TaxID=3346353 RepID=UPI0036EEA200
MNQATSPASALLETLRLSRGLTQTDLARATGIAQATLSKTESGVIDLDEDRWERIASALNVPARAFTEASTAVLPDRIFHRKRRSTPKSEIRRIGADLALTRQRVDRLIAAPATNLKRHDLEDGFVTPQEIAQLVRSELDVGTEPIPDLTGLLESAGVTVLRWPLDSLQVDAIAAWPEDTAPLILLGEHAGAERLRFTIAHELGHAVLHNGEATEQQEREADAFAAEFLLPAARLRNEWPNPPHLEDLLPLKRRWGISLSALIRRARDCDVLDEAAYRHWNIVLSTSGMHRREPDPLPPERPRLLINTIQTELANGTTVEKLAERTHMSTDEFSSVFLEKSA